MSVIQERGSTHVYKVNRISRDEIENMVSLCVYEQPAFCSAACPLKLDTKAMLAAAARGDFKKALTIYEKAAVFPNVVSAGCRAPCEEKCRLCEFGDGIAVRDIERAVAKYGERPRSGGVFRMKKKKSVALLGSGLFALFLAGELEKKVYPLTVFCEEPDMEAYLQSAAPFLDADAFEDELKRLSSKEITFRFGCALTKELLEEKRAEFDVICASAYAAVQIFPDAACDERLMLYEAQTLIMGGDDRDVLDAAFGAKKAALTVDRLAQRLPPDSARGDEGAAETRLYASLDDLGALRRVDCGAEGYTVAQAAEEAGRCIQCHCDECMKSCAYLKHYKKNPGLLAREIYNNTQIIMGDHPLNKPMNACALCGQCTVVCPNGFDMARVCKSARENMVSTDKMPLAPHEFALMDMLFSNGEAYLCRKQPGHDRCKYVFFPGCQAAAIAPGTVRAAYEDLCARLDGGVALMLGCCGAICDWAGRCEMYARQFDFIENELAKLGCPTVIAACPTCRKKLAEHGNTEAVGIWNILDAIGLSEGAGGPEHPAALHDSCGARGDAETQRAVRSLLKRLGVHVVETAFSGDSSPCCGYGGLTAYANREIAHELAEKCLERSDLPYVSYCMACRDRFAREGRESRHILELVYGTDAGTPPDISEKRYNRLTLKNELLRDIWGEEVENVELPYRLEFDSDALKMMDERMILKSDIIAVIEAYRENGEAIEDAETGYLMLRRRLGNVTFWVALTETEDSYIVRRAYSHRMNVVKRQG